MQRTFYFYWQKEKKEKLIKNQKLSLPSDECHSLLNYEVDAAIECNKNGN